jgi:filamentous hemagglutinin family protein
LGQVVGDNTLGAESSLVTPIPGAFQIDGGATRGANLFHSFSQFSVPTQSTAYFNNAPNIQNIISRVTGGSGSNIDGVIKANGTANLFLINPNGIIFGPNAKLNIGGSFIGSTASSAIFADGTKFSATDTRTQPLLTVNVPIGLQLGDNPAPIKVQGSNLEVKPNQNLVLVGGDISLDAGKLTALGGRIELGGLSVAGNVGLNENGSLNFPNHVARSDVSVTNGASMNVRAGDGGFITINARNLAMSGKSELIAGIGKDLGSSQAQAGDVEIQASGTVSLDDSKVKNQVEEKATGNAGNIKIATGSLILSNNAELNAGTFGVGNAGQVIINASDSISMNNDGQLQSRVNKNAMGNSGGIDITTGNLFLKFSGISATTDGVGNSGPVIIKASGNVLIESSRVRSRVAENGKGNSSGIYISADSIFLTKNTELNASTFGVGDAGKVILRASRSISLMDHSDIRSRVNKNAMGNSGGIDITTGNLSINETGLTASTDGVGNSGPIIIRASGSISLLNGSFVSSRVSEHGTGNSDGIYISANSLSLTNQAEVNTSTLRVGNAGPIIIEARDNISLMDKSFIRGRVEEQGIGNSGSLYITTKTLSLTNKANLNVESIGQGNAGNINVAASSIRLDNGAFINANTKGGQGNINLNSVDLVLRHGSNITTNATGSIVSGGNITINTGVLAAVENSDISANSQDFRGGNVSITTQGIFGTKFRSQLTPESDITATGADSSLNGTVTINSPDVDPSRGLAELPVEPVNVEVAQGCQSGENQASIEFFNTGRGGLAPNPYEPIGSSNTWEDVPLPTQRAENPIGAASASASPTTSSKKLVEAKGWLINEKGQVALVAEMPTTQSQVRCRLH